MRRWILAATAAGLALSAGCTNEDAVAAAKKRYALVKKHGSKQDVCNASREVERAYLNADDEEGYKLQKVTADVDCNAALLDRL